MKKTSFIGIFLTLFTVLAGCTKESNTNCVGNLKLKFSFSLHTQSGNLFDSNIQIVRVYLFDEQNILRHIQDASGEQLTNDYVMNVNVQPAKYKIIAWASGSSDLSKSYDEGQTPDPQSHDYTKGLEIGKTSLEDFYMYIKSVETKDIPEATVPVENEFDDLFYGALGTRNPLTSLYTLETIDVRQDVDTERTIDLIRNTNILKLSITGINHLDLKNNLNVWTSSNNGEYTAKDNIIGANALSIRYTPYYASSDNTTFNANIKIQRLMEDKAISPVYLHIQSPDGRKFPEEPIDLIDAFLQARDPLTNEHIYKSQSDFDKIYEHPINISIDASLRVRIFIGQWEIVDVVPAG